MDIVTLTGIAASVLTALSLMPQLIKVIKEKKAENISMGMLTILFAGLGLWIWYGAMKKDWIIILANAVSFLINFLLASFSLRYKKKH